MIEFGLSPDSTEEWKARPACGYHNGYLGMFGPLTDAGEKDRSLNSELANGRLAMAAITGMVRQNGSTGAMGYAMAFPASALSAGPVETDGAGQSCFVAPQPPDGMGFPGAAAPASIGPISVTKELGVQAPVGFWDPAGFCDDIEEIDFEVCTYAADLLPIEKAAGRQGDTQRVGTMNRGSRKFGFITQDSYDDDIFVMPFSCPVFGRMLPPIGTRVAYGVSSDPRTGKLRAKDVRPLDAGEPGPRGSGHGAGKRGPRGNGTAGDEGRPAALPEAKAGRRRKDQDPGEHAEEGRRAVQEPPGGHRGSGQVAARAGWRPVLRP